MIRSPLLLGTSTERDGVTRIALVRAGLGALGLLATRPVQLAFGLPAAQDTPAARALGRLFGVRNVVLAAWALIVRDADHDTRQRCYQLNATVDAADMVVVLWPVLRRQGLARFGIASAALAISATLAWLELLARQGGPCSPVGKCVQRGAQTIDSGAIEHRAEHRRGVEVQPGPPCLPNHEQGARTSTRTSSAHRRAAG
ncbi:MAG: hypothetical protein GEU83_08955 [Pseudonocardiaceae bacterium]|nr:hypothetical protein [Pseudonocardiaceae bacterium]